MVDVAQIINTVVNAVPEIRPYLLPETLKAIGGGYDAIRNEYFATIYDAVDGYLSGNRPVTSFSNKAREGMSTAFMDAAYLGYEETSGETSLDEDTQKWLDSRIAQERDFIVGMFDRLKAEWQGLDPATEAMARAEGYAKTLDGIYTEAKMRGSTNITLIFVGDDGAESCPDCKKMKGKKNKIQYILDNGLIPAPGNSNYECNGYNCQHFWADPKTGEEYKF